MSREISVVHLVYVPYGVELFRRFLDSYVKHEAGAEHELVVMFNGFGGEEELTPFLKVIEPLGIKYSVLLSGERWDISSYFFAAKSLESQYLLFLNSYSTILAGDWLKFYRAAMGKPKVGAVGATGAGWRSEFKNYLERIEGSRLKHIKSLAFMRAHFGKFRGPHLRTNAFFVRRSEFLSLTYNKPVLEAPVGDLTKDSKLRTVYFEHGNESMTYQLARKGLKALVVDRHGDTYEPADWPSSRTFWISDQENLLVHDNRTLRYQEGDERLRSILSYEAWGIRRK